MGSRWGLQGGISGAGGVHRSLGGVFKGLGGRGVLCSTPWELGLEECQMSQEGKLVEDSKTHVEFGTMLMVGGGEGEGEEIF